jgi:Subtilase family
VNRVFVQALPILAVAALAACSGGSTNQSFVPQNALTAAASGDVPFLTMDPVRRLCPTPEGPERVECFAMVRTDVIPTPEIAPQAHKKGETCPFSQGYCPNDLQAAYNLPSSTEGKDEVVAIVDAYGYKHAASDLAVFRKTMGLSACKAKCLRIVNQSGNSSPLPSQPPSSDTGWLGEESVDLDMVSGICPKCKIILVQANNNDTNNLFAGVKTAVRLGAKYIGASWGTPEFGPDNPDFHQPGVVISAAAGDEGGGTKFGGGPIQPCTYTYVTCVGGTHLVTDSHNKRGWSETVWNDWTFDECGSGSSPCGATGSACSKDIPKPSWQTDKGCTTRSAADTSATASLRAPVIAYNSEIGCTPPNCYWLFGGTSVSTQIISAVYALAGNAATQNGPEGIWKHHAGNVYDVTVGNNVDPSLGVTCASPVKYICTARAGFDGPTGWGTPAGVGGF